MKFGGDGFYAGWPPLYNEPALKIVSDTGRFFADEIKRRLDFIGFLDHASCPVAESLQPKLMHFTTNQLTEEEMDIQADALRKSILYFS